MAMLAMSKKDIAINNMMAILRVMHQTNYKYTEREIAAVIFRKG